MLSMPPIFLAASVVLEIVVIVSIGTASILKPGGKRPASGSSTTGMLKPGGKRPANESTAAISITGMEGGAGEVDGCVSAGNSGLIELKNVSIGPTGCFSVTFSSGGGIVEEETKSGGNKALISSLMTNLPKSRSKSDCSLLVAVAAVESSTTASEGSTS